MTLVKVRSRGINLAESDYIEFYAYTTGSTTRVERPLVMGHKLA